MKKEKRDTCEFTIRPKEYTLVDFIAIPFKNAPLYTSIVTVNRLLSALLPSIQVLVTAKFVDTAVGIFNGSQSKNQIFIPLFLIMGMIAYQYLNGSLLNIVNLKLSMRLSELFRVAVVEKRSKLSYEHIENNDTWDLINRTCKEPVERITGGFDKLLGAADLVIRVISLLVIVMTQVRWAGLMIIGVSLPLFWISIKGGKDNYEANKEAQKHQRKAGYLGSILSGRDNVEERTMFSYTDSINEKWYEKYETARKINKKAQLRNFIRMKSASMVTIFVSLFIVGILIPALGNGKISIGMFMGLVTATFNLVQLMSWQLSWITSELANGREYLKDLSLFSKLSQQKNATDLPSNMKEFSLNHIEFKNVSFKYPDTERYILKDCSFILKPKEHYAFVGINGAGKTTITKLLTGMYDNFEGEILINSKSIREYKLSELKGLFSVVYQDFAKYYIQLKDNIKLGNVLEDNEAKMLDTIKTIELTDTVEKLENGASTYLGKIKENGVDLSGGQWQRLAIARALYSNAKMYILDEPTAALDPVAESRIYEMFGQMSMGKSTLFITHRLGAAKLADKILVIDKGKVAEEGNHKILIRHGGIYAKMFDSQKGWYEE